MFASLLAKEIKLSLHSAKYIGGFVIIAAAILLSAISLGESYRAKRREFSSNEHQRNEILDTKAHANRMSLLLSPSRPPARMSVLFSDNAVEAGAASFFKNPIALLYRKCDVSDVVVFLLSIMAIVMSYDAVSGEREQGTLRLQSVFGVARPMFLVAKLLAGIIVISFPIVVGLMLSVVYLEVAGLFDWGALEWVSLTAILVATLLYFGCFFCVGLFASTLSRRSTTSLVIAYVVWVVFAILVPNTSPFIARQIYPVTGVAATRAEIASLLDKQRDELGRRLAAEAQAAFAAQHGSDYDRIANATESELAVLVQHDRRLGDLYRQLQQAIDSAWAEANTRQRQKAKRLEDDLARRMNRQTELTRSCALVSPSTNLVCIVQELAGVGAPGQEQFDEEVTMYYRHFWQYFEDKIAAAVEDNPQFTANDFIDITDRPSFSYRERPLADRLAPSWLYFVILGSFTLAFFMASAIAFHRYDVR